MTRIVGLDLSLTGTGLARINAEPPLSCRVEVSRVTSKAPARRKGDPPPSLGVRSTRLRRVAGEVINLCRGADLIVVEGPSYGSGAESGTWDRAGLWWLIIGRLTGAGLQVVEVPPATVKTYALGKGSGPGTGKDEVLAAVIRRYLGVVEVPGNNEADALILAAMGARFCGHPIEPDGLPQTHLRALDKVRWDPTT